MHALLKLKLRSLARVALTGFAILVGGCMFPVGAAAVTLYQENFDGLALGPYINELFGDGTDWTATPPAEIALDTTTTPSGGIAEFFGWTFHDKDAWITTAGDQSRSQFTRGSGVVAVADPDEYDDNPVVIEPDLFNVFMSIPLSVAGAEDTIQIGFDSSFFPFGGMTGLVDVSFDGGTTFSNLLTLVASAAFPEQSIDHIDERVSLEATRTGDDLVVRFGMVDAGNDFWWAVDNISISTVPEPGTGALLGLGLAALARGRRQRSRGLARG